MGKRANEHFFVLSATSSETVINDGSTAVVTGSGNSNAGNGQMLIADGTGETSPNVAIGAGATVANFSKIKLVQGTEHAAQAGQTAAGGFAIPLLEATVEGNRVTAWNGQSYVRPEYSMWYIGADNGETDALDTAGGGIADNTEYIIKIGMRGTRMDMHNSVHGVEVVNVSFTTPDYTALGYSEAQKVDDLVQNLVYNANLHSEKLVGTTGKKPFVAFAVDYEATTSTSGNVAVSAISTVDAGSIAYPSTYYGFSSDAESIASGANSKEAKTWADAAAFATGDLDTNSLIIDVDRTTAGDGSTATTNGIVIMGTEITEATEDRVENYVVRLEVSLFGGFDDAVNIQEANVATNGEGGEAKLKKRWKSVAQSKLRHSNRSEFPVIDILPNFWAAGQRYDVYTIEQDVIRDTRGLNSLAAEKEIIRICVPVSSTTTTTEIEAALNTYMASTTGAFSAVNL